MSPMTAGPETCVMRVARTSIHRIVIHRAIHLILNRPRITTILLPARSVSLRKCRSPLRRLEFLCHSSSRSKSHRRLRYNNRSSKPHAFCHFPADLLFDSAPHITVPTRLTYEAACRGVCKDCTRTESFKGVCTYEKNICVYCSRPLLRIVCSCRGSLYNFGHSGDSDRER